MPQVYTYVIKVEVFQTAVTRAVEQNEDYHYLCFRHCSITMVFALLCIWYGIIFHHLVKKLAEIICHYKNFIELTLILAMCCCSELQNMQKDVSTVDITT